MNKSEVKKKGTNTTETIKKENQRVVLTKQLLKEALISLLKEENIYKISIRRLCDIAGINRSTFYKYYGSQYELLTDMENEILSYIQENVEDIASGIVVQNIERLTVILSYLEKNSELAQLLLNNNVDPDFPKKLIDLPQIQDAIRRGIANKYDEAYQDYIFTFIIYGGYNLIKEWINKENRESAETMARLMTATIEGLYHGE